MATATSGHFPSGQYQSLYSFVMLGDKRLQRPMQSILFIKDPNEFKHFLLITGTRG